MLLKHCCIGEFWHLEGSIFRFLFLGGFVVIAKEVSHKMIYPIECYYGVNSVESCKGPVYP